MQNWESLIAERSRPAERMAESIAAEAERERKRKYEHSQKRKASHEAWRKSPAGRKSEHERCKRYQQTENGKEHKRKNSRLYFLRHKDDAEWMAHRYEVQKAWREKNADRLREQKREWKKRKRAEKKAMEAA